MAYQFQRHIVFHRVLSKNVHQEERRFNIFTGHMIFRQSV